MRVGLPYNPGEPLTFRQCLHALIVVALRPVIRS